VPPGSHADVTITKVTENPGGIEFVLQIGAAAYINSGFVLQKILQTGNGAQFNQPVHLVAGESIVARVGYVQSGGVASPITLSPGSVDIIGTVDQGK
jgi:hypothetical protein